MFGRPELAIALVAAAASCGGSVVDAPHAEPDPYDNACPQAGGAMVLVPDAFGGSFCIDGTEVTNGAYATWLATDPSFDLMPAHECYDNDWEDGPKIDYRDYRPKEWSALPTMPLMWPASSELDDYPVVYVTWCDATAYCVDHGKRLCAAIGGGELTPDHPPEPSGAEFSSAISRAGAQAFVYGDSYVDGACRDPSLGVSAVGSAPACEGGYPGLFDLDGNAAEINNGLRLEDSYSPDVGIPGVVGYGFEAGGEPPDGTPPPVLGWHTLPFNGSAPFVGFRCCADSPASAQR